MEKNIIDMDLCTTPKTFPTVELDFNSLPKNSLYGDISFIASSELAKKNKNIKATIYSHECPSVNFHEQTWSVFFGVCGDNQKKILEMINVAFRYLPGVRCKFSDYGELSDEWRSHIHIEGGIAWREIDAATWVDE